MGIMEEYEALKSEYQRIESETLKIVLFGQPGAGKSSLINAIVGENIAKVGPGTDETKEMAEVCAHNGLVFVDLPGYGTAKFPENAYFEKFRIEDFDFFLCVFSGKFGAADTAFFRTLKQKGKKCLFVRTKADDIWQDDKSIEELKDIITRDVHSQVGSPVKVYFVSSRDKSGVSELNDAIMESIGEANRVKKERFAREILARTIAQLAAKKEACESIVTYHAGLAAANAINPVPGIDIALDITVIYDMFSKIRDTYGLNKRKLEAVAPLIPIARNVLNYAAKEGIAILLKQYAGKVAIKQVAKYVPFVGQGIAAMAGFTVVRLAGMKYLDDCHETAMEILSREKV